jgi:hypothetical protein
MIRYLLLGATLLASCASTRPTYQPTAGERRSAHAAGPLYYEATPDSLPAPKMPLSLGVHVAGKSRAKVSRQSARVLRRWHRQFQRDAKRYTRVGVAEASLPKKCKGCTIVYGDATVAGKKAQVAAGAGAVASVVEKKAGPAQVASDSSTQNALLGAGNLAAVHGDGNTLPQTTTTQQAADWRATLAKPIGYALATLGTVLIGGGAIYLIVAYRRKNLLNNG